MGILLPGAKPNAWQTTQQGNIIAKESEALNLAVVEDNTAQEQTGFDCTTRGLWEYRVAGIGEACQAKSR